MTSVYRCFDADGALLYVGCSEDPDRRFYAHRRTVWFCRVVRIDIEDYENRYAALEAEALAIRDESPIYNKAVPVAPVAEFERRTRMDRLMKELAEIMEIARRLEGDKLEQFLHGNYEDMKANGFAGFVPDTDEPISG